LWLSTKTTNIENKLGDIYNLLNYLKNSSLENFINDMYLNQDIELNNDNTLYLTTIHGAKGLEWEYVYIIDVDSKNFPSMRPKYYIDSLNDMDEERRLFYVAASRAKKYLYLTYYEDNDVMMSPLIYEINKDNYNQCGVTYNIIKPTLIISKDVANYLRYVGYNNISQQLIELKNERSCITGKERFTFNIPINIEKLNCATIIGNFMDYTISKMVHINYTAKTIKFDLPIIHKDTNFPKKIYEDYIDPLIDWRNILDKIFFISSYKNNMELNILKEFLTSSNSLLYYLEVERSICKIINSLKPKEIRTHYSVSYGSVYGEIDILCDDTIIEIKSSTTEIATIANICQVLLYCYLLKKREIQINKIILYNPLNGEINTIDTSDFNFIKFKKTIYNNSQNEAVI
jgi:hypothetical protein